MNFEMKLDDSPFREMAEGRKTLEVRLSDSKREKITTGDRIIFLNPMGKILVEVIEKRKYKDIEELVMNEDISKAGSIYKSSQDWINHIDSFYPREKQRENGVLAIEIRVINP